MKFYKYSIGIEDDENFSSLENIKNNKEPHIDYEGIKVDLFHGEFFFDRFYGINIELGDATHYSDEVVDIKDNLKIKENPRKETEIELDKQFLLLIDINNKTIYLSKANEKYRKFTEDQLAKETNHSVSIKHILDEESFKNSLDSISELNFLFENLDLFNKADDLSIRLNEEKLHYEADSIRVIFKYKHKKLYGKLKDKLSKLINKKDTYKNLKIVGKDVNGLESIFQPNAISRAVEIKTQLEEKTKKLDYKKVLEKLIREIRENE